MQYVGNGQSLLHVELEGVGALASGPWGRSTCGRIELLVRLSDGAAAAAVTRAVLVLRWGGGQKRAGTGWGKGGCGERVGVVVWVGETA